MSRYELKGKVALVSGAARGIGLATARALHARGTSVALLDLDSAAIQEAAAGVGERTLGLAADVTDAGALADAVDATVERFGGLDVAVANAGIAPAAATVRVSGAATFERVIEVNLLGAYRTMMAALPHVLERRGHLTVVGSIYSFANGALVAPYAVSKAGVEALARAMRVELAPHGATAGVAYYGFVATEMVRQGFDEDPLARRVEEEMPGFVRRRVSPEEAAETLVRGIERRSARVFAPPFLRPYSALRGILNPVIDWSMGSRRALREVVRAADVEGRTAGREITASRTEDRPPDPDTR